MNLREQTVHGVQWNTAAQVGQQVTQLVTLAVLGRLLSPEDFGLLGMATVFTGFALLFNDLGTSAAVIQQRDPSEELLSSIFWANLLFGALLSLVVLLGAPVVSAYYRDPRVTPVLRVLALMFPISALGTLQKSLLEKRMAFHLTAHIEVAAVAVGAVVAIALAIAHAGVWALVAQSLTIFAVTSVLFWIFSDWRPAAVLHWGELRTVSSFSLNLTGYNIFNFFARNADYLLIGRFLGATQLGLYTLAYRIMLYPVQRLTVVVNRVLFPVYSQLQQDPERFRRAYLKTIGMIAAIAFPAMMGLWVVAEPMVHVVFGSKWQGAVPVLQILVPIGLMQSVGATVGPVYQAKGRTDLLFRWGLASGILVVAAFVIGLRWGIVGVAFAYLVCNLICVVPNLYIPLRLIELPLSRLAAAVSRPLLGSVLMAAGLVGVRALLPQMSHSFALQFLVPLGIVAYIGISLVVNREQVRQALDMLRVRSGAH